VHFHGRLRCFLEGDHIKVTASKYPFPTVCADKQSTDWFHAISRTLKWNERERQKSFVVVEEGPEGTKNKKKKRLSKTASGPPATEEETLEDEEEDEVSDEEEDKFDIDDSSPEAAAANNSMTDRDQQLGQEKTKEVIAEEQIHKMLADTAARRRSKSRSRSRNRSGTRSGIDSPSRYAGPEPHLSSILSPRRVEFDLSESSDSGYVEAGRNGTRDDLRTARKVSGKSRIPKDRDPSELDNVKTPTVGNLPYVQGRAHSRSRSGEYIPHRAFAVWGQDESDSNASDSDA